MWRVLYVFLALALLSGGVIWLADNPGTVTILWQGYEIRTSFVTGIFAVSVLTLIALLGYRLVATFLNSPAGFASFLSARREKKGYRALSSAMVAVASGDGREAGAQARLAHKLLDEPAMTLLLAAQAAQLQGQGAEADSHFRAMLEHGETEFLGLRGLYLQARRDGDPETALGHAAEAHALRPHAGWAAEALFELQVQLGRYAEAAKTLDEMVANRLVTRDAGRRRRTVLLTAQAQTVRSDAADDTVLLGDAQALAAEAADLEPGFAPAVGLAAELLAQNGDARKAGRLIERAWATHPHPQLGDIYLTLKPDETPFERLKRARSLAARRPGDGESQVVLARAALAAGDLETAAQALEPLLETVPTRRICLLMGELESRRGIDRTAAQNWLSRAARAPADACWMADGYMSDAWVAVVPATGKFDALNWQMPASGTASAAQVPLIPVAEPARPADDASHEEAQPVDAEPAVEARPAEPALPQALVVAPDDPGPLTDERAKPEHPRP